MLNQSSFKKRIEELMSQSLLEKEKKREEMKERMEGIQRDQARFKELASHLLLHIVEPRLKTLEDFFDDAKYQSSDVGYGGTVRFNQNNELPAAVNLDVSICFNPVKKSIRLLHRLQIIPTLIDYQREDELELNLGSIDEAQVISFVENKIADSVETYLKLYQEPAYRIGNLVTDPVCGMIFSRQDATASAEYESRTYFFCVHACKNHFLENPLKYTKNT